MLVAARLWARGQNFNRGETTLSPANVATLAEAWSAPLDAGVGGQPLVDGRMVVTSGGVITGGQASFVVTATARGTGAPLWRRELPTGTGASNFERLLSIADGRVLVFRQAPRPGGGLVLQFEELDGQTGATLRTSPVPAVVDRDTIVVAGDAIAYQRFDQIALRHEIVVRSRQTFDVLWTATLSDTTLTKLAPMVVAGGRLTTRDVDATGQVLRSYAIGGCGAATCSPVATVPLPPPPMGAGQFLVLAAMDDGRQLVGRQWFDGSALHDDILAIAPDGSVAFIIPLADVVSVSVAGNRIYVVGADPATPGIGRSLLAFEGSDARWRADGTDLLFAAVVAGGVVLVADSRVDGIDVRAYRADGCATGPPCDPLAVLDGGPGTAVGFGMSVAFGSVYVSQPAPGNRLIAWSLPRG